jgi:hypothetical protein
MESGYYWAYSLDSRGEPLESPGHPDIVYYNHKTKTVRVIGYADDIDYSPNRYRLLYRVEFNPL